MQLSLDKLVGKKVIITTCDKVVYSGELVDYGKEGKIKLKNAFVEYSPKLTAEQVILQGPKEELVLPLEHVLKYEKMILWSHPYFPSR